MDNFFELYRDYSAAMAYVEVQDNDYNIGIGSAFHIGDGIFITARHVVCDKKILKMETKNEIVELVSAPLYHPDPDIDIAIIVTANTDLLHIELGGHLDDWIDDGLILSKVLVMGYPPIPLSIEPVLISTVAEINGIVDTYIGSRHPQFILSATARGGFSGGVAILNDGSALGVITESLVADYKPEELGYLSVLTIEPILHCLAHHKVMPNRVHDFWRIEGSEKSLWQT